MYPCKRISQKNIEPTRRYALNQDRDRVQEMTTLLDVLPVGIGIATDGRPTTFVPISP